MKTHPRFLICRLKYRLINFFQEFTGVPSGYGRLVIPSSRPTLILISHEKKLALDLLTPFYCGSVQPKTLSLPNNAVISTRLVLGRIKRSAVILLILLQLDWGLVWFPRLPHPPALVWVGGSRDKTVVGGSRGLIFQDIDDRSLFGTAYFLSSSPFALPFLDSFSFLSGGFSGM